MSYRVKNWRQFQHYSDRNPPWIKLHFSMLSSMDWVTLDDASRVLAVACMLIASRNEGVVPSNPEYIRRVAYLNKSPNFKPLIDCGFLEPASDCKQTLAEFRPETETETETETDAQAKKPALDEWVPVESWRGFVEMRRKSGHPLTDRAKQLALTKLDELRNAGHDPAEVLDLAVLNGWRSLYPPKGRPATDLSGSQNPIYADMGLR